MLYSANPRIYACGHERLPVRYQLDYPSSERASGRRKQREGRRGNCTNCNRQHPTGKCPSANSRCRACGRHGHWEAACRSKSTNDGLKPSSQKPRRPSSQSPSGIRGNKQAVQQLRVNEDSNDDDTFQNLEFKTVIEKDGRDDIFCDSGYLSVQRVTRALCNSEGQG